MLPAASRGAGRGWALGAVAREASAGRRDGPPPCCSSVSRETLPAASRAPAAADIRGDGTRGIGGPARRSAFVLLRAFHVKRGRRPPGRRPRPRHEALSTEASSPGKTDWLRGRERFT